MTFLPYAKCLRLRKLQIWSPIIAKGTVDLAVGWALLNLKQHLTKHTEEKMEIHKVKSAHHATHKNVGFGCSTNAKVRGENLINIISIELMTSSARDASFKSQKHQLMMEIWSYEFCSLRTTSFTFQFDVLCSYSLKTQEESLTSFL